jgi:TPP-dependent pyruvate/acetoin dehydrogenase alpha subunit
MDFCIEDTREKPLPPLKQFVADGVFNLDQLTDWLRSMYEIRFFEEKVFEILGRNVIKGASHLYAGQEAVAVGAIAAIERGDVIASTHRGHGHCGAVGNKYADGEQQRQDHWNRMMAELMGRQTGYCKGRGGSMHIAEVQKCNNLGSTGIVGGNQAPAVGAALAEKYRGTGRAVLCFFGDGASNTGSFHVLAEELVRLIVTALHGQPPDLGHAFGHRRHGRLFPAQKQRVVIEQDRLV